MSEFIQVRMWGVPFPLANKARQNGRTPQGG